MTRKIGDSIDTKFSAALIRSAMSGETPMGGIVSFVSSMAQSKKSKMSLDSNKYGINLPLAMSGFGTEKPTASIHLGPVSDEEAVHIGGSMNDVFTIDDENTSTYHIDANKASLPTLGCWTINIASDVQ